jgi:hypothetical protein
MAYCTNCGHQLVDGARFCLECGAPIANVKASEQPVRKTMFDGEVHKCPQCGEVLQAFVAVCPSCGYEIRGASASDSVKEFAAKINAVSSGKEKAEIIRNYPVSNTKEDIFEFMIVASTNLDERPNSEVFEAWIVKIEQCYQKAKLAFGSESDFVKIQAMYESTMKKIKKARRKAPMRRALKIILPIAISLGVTVAFFAWLGAPDPKAEAEENARLEAIVVEVENALAEKEYDLALMQAKSIDYSAYKTNDEFERQWDIKRDYLIKQIIKAAAEDGIVIEYPTDTADEKDREQSTTAYTYPDYEDEIKQNVDEFNEYVEGIEDSFEQMLGDSDAATEDKETNVSESDTETKPAESTTENTSSTDNLATNTESFNAEEITKQLKVTEHCRVTYGHYFPALVVENPTDFDLSLSVDIKFYNKDGKLVGAQSDEVYAFEKGTKTIVQFSVDEEFDRMEYELAAKEEEYYHCVISSLKVESVTAKDKEIVSITNTGEWPAEFVECVALFFKDGKLVTDDYTYFADDDMQIKPGKTITAELNAWGEEYDKVEFYLTGRAEK